MQDALTFAAATVEIIALALFVIGVCFPPKRRTAKPQGIAPKTAPRTAPCPIASVHVLEIEPDDSDDYDPDTEPVFTWDDVKVADMRKMCTFHGIQWRNAHGKNRHLTKAEMIAALS